MQLTDYIVQVQTQLASAAALGGDATRATAEALSTAAEPAIRLAVLAAVSAAADEITAALLDVPGAPAVSVHLDGADLRVDVRPTQHPEAGPTDAGAGAADDTDATARISLRLSESLKAQIEAAARTGSVSVNTWLVRAATAALAGQTAHGWGRSWSGSPGSAHHVTGWING